MSAPRTVPPPGVRGIPAAPGARLHAIGLPGARGIAVADAPAFRLPGQHFAAALFFLATGSVGLVWIAPELAAGLYLSPHVAGVTHCFTLGWLTMTIFGALYQLLPVALGVPIRSERWGHVSFWSYAPGVALFATGIATSSLFLRHVGIVLVAFGIVCLVVNIASSLRAAPERDVVWAAVAIALAFLTSTLGIGLVLLHSLHTGLLAGARVRVLAVHLHVAMIGWVLIMIVGISSRLLPMFLLAHGASTRWSRHAIAFLAAGVCSLSAGVLCGLTRSHSVGTAVLAWAGVALIDAGVLCYLEQVRLVYTARVRPKLDAGLRHVAMSLLFLCVSALLGPVVLYQGSGHPGLAIAYVALALLGSLVLFAIGQFYKIVPFLVWISRFRNDMGRKRVPTVAELYSARIAHGGLVALSLAVVALAAGAALGSPTVVRAGALLFAGGVALFISQMARVALAGAVR